MKLRTIGIANFRSIGEEPVHIDLTKKATILIGQNNSGKSNVLKGLSLAIKRDLSTSSIKREELHYRKTPHDEESARI